jgi:hypothetical protein
VAAKRLRRTGEQTIHPAAIFAMRLVLAVVYFVLMLPFGLIIRFLSDPLKIKRRPAAWLDSPPLPSRFEDGRRQD